MSNFCLNSKGFRRVNDVNNNVIFCNQTDILSNRFWLVCDFPQNNAHFWRLYFFCGRVYAVVNLGSLRPNIRVSNPRAPGKIDQLNVSLFGGSEDAWDVSSKT